MTSYDEKLRRYLEEKERQEQKKKARQAKAYKEYQAAYRKAHGHKTRQEQARERRIKQKRMEKEREARENERQERLMFIEQRTVSFYGEKWCEKEIPEEMLYTKEELMNPPEGETGRLNWLQWDKMVEECRRMFQ